MKSEDDRQIEMWQRSGCDPQWAPDGPDDDKEYARLDRGYWRRRAMIQAIDGTKGGTE